MKRALWFVVVLAALVAGCGKKGPAQAAASPESTKYLPADAKAYLEIDLKAVLAWDVLAPYKAEMFGKLPPSCQTAVDAIERISVAGYGSLEDLFKLFGRRKRELTPEAATGEGQPAAPAEPAEPMPDVAALLTGPTTAALRACFDDIAKQDGGQVREEDRNGQKVLIGGKNGEFALVSPADTTHVLTTMPRLDAVLATVAGGPSIDGSPLLAGLASIPTGTVVAVMLIPESIAAMMSEGLQMFAGGKPVPAPVSAAFSVSLGSPMTIASAATMADEAGAQRMEELVNGGVSMAKTALAAAGDRPEVAPYKTIVNSLSVSRSGASVSVRVSIPGNLLSDMLLKGDSR
jgi:hypothetical protein